MTPIIVDSPEFDPSSLLTSDEVAQMRATAASALPDSAVVYSPTFTSDSGGGGTTAWTASGTVACRIAPVMSNVADERVAGARVSPEAEFVVTLPFNADVDEAGRLVIDGATYEVEAVRDRSWNLTTRVEVVRQT